MDGQADYEEEEEGGRVTRGLRRRPQWRWNGETLRKGGGDVGDVMFGRKGATLTLTSVTAADSGKYSCHHSGRMLSSFKVIVAGPPESPVLSCYKRSPSSKIRCEWTPQQPVTLQPRCYLFLSKDLSMFFSRSNCSYSVKTSRCWCALDHNEDEQRVIHTAYLCVTSAAGNVTSALLDFTPLSILTPDPPSSVAVRVDEGHERRLRVTWGFPRSWKLHDRHFKLIYEIIYRPTRSLGAHGPQQEILTTQHCTITDALPGVEYVIRLRARDEYDGLWSDWSTPVYAHSWTAQQSAVLNDSLSTTVYPFYTDNEGSGTDDYTDVPEAEDRAEGVWHHILWITGSCVLMSTILAAYIFRHKERFVSKVQSFSIVTICIEPSRPAPAPAPQEARALVVFASPRYKEALPNQVEEEEEGEEEEEKVEERREAMHFNNTSYFLVERNS
ncbi:interleukin-6 receptor subunit alpha [Polymixia lowei]